MAACRLDGAHALHAGARGHSGGAGPAAARRRHDRPTRASALRKAHRSAADVSLSAGSAAVTRAGERRPRSRRGCAAVHDREPRSRRVAAWTAGVLSADVTHAGSAFFTARKHAKLNQRKYVSTVL